MLLTRWVGRVNSRLNLETFISQLKELQGWRKEVEESHQLVISTQLSTQSISMGVKINIKDIIT
jgi:hypothetical protein